MLIIAVALATTLVVAAAASLGTMNESIRVAMGSIAGLADVKVQPKFGGPFEADVVQTIKSWPEVREVSPSFSVGVQLRQIGDSGGTTAAAQGVDPVAESRVHPRTFAQGRMIQKTGEVAVDRWIARRLDAEVGDQLELVVLGETRVVTLVGILDRPVLAVLQKPLVMIPLSQAHELAGLGDLVNEVHIQLESDVDVDAFIEARQGQLPDLLELSTPNSGQANVKRVVNATNLMLLLTTVLVYLSASFLILTTMTTTVTERQRELAILRCLGTGRTQIAISQLLSGLMLSVGGSLLGAPVGIFLAYLLYERFSNVLIGGFDVNVPGVSLAVGASIVAGLIGAGYPAVLAAKVSPLEAMVARARPASKRGVILCGVVGVLFVSVQPMLLILPTGMDNSQLFWFYMSVGLPLMLIGFFILGVPVLVLVARLFAPLLATVLRLPGELLQQTLLATPMRNGFTGGALMVGLGLLIALWTVGRGAMDGWFEQLDMPDAFVHSYYSLTPQQEAAIAAAPAVTSSCSTTMFPVNVRGMKFGVKDITPAFTQFVSFEPESFFNMTEIEWVEGDEQQALARLKQGQAILISKEFYRAHGIGVGGVMTIDTGEGPVDFEVAGVVGSVGLDVAVAVFGIQNHYDRAAVSSVFGTRSDAQRYFGVDASNLMLLELDPSYEDHEAVSQLREAAPGVVAGTSRKMRRHMRWSIEKLMRVSSSVAIATLIISCLGVGNLIAANIAARRFEYGVLRAIGSDRWLLGRLVIGETLVLVITGGLIGTFMGMQLAVLDRAFNMRMMGIEYTVNLQWGVIGWGWFALAAAALLAALPAIGRLVATRTLRLLAAGR